MRKNSLKIQTIQSMVSAIHEFLINLENQARQNNKTEIIEKLKTAQQRLLELKAISAKLANDSSTRGISATA